MLKSCRKYFVGTQKRAGISHGKRAMGVRAIEVRVYVSLSTTCSYFLLSLWWRAYCTAFLMQVAAQPWWCLWDGSCHQLVGRSIPSSIFSFCWGNFRHAIRGERIGLGNSRKLACLLIFFFQKIGFCISRNCHLYLIFPRKWVVMFLANCLLITYIIVTLPRLTVYAKQTIQCQSLFLRKIRKKMHISECRLLELFPSMPCKTMNLPVILSQIPACWAITM